MEYSLETSFGPIFAVRDDVYNAQEIGAEVQVGFKSPGPVLIPGS